MAPYIASIHYLALAIGFSGLLIRLYFLNNSLANRDIENSKLKPIFYGDNLWGLAALLWIVTGLWRAFGGLEKGTTFYLSSPWFHFKMTLFLVIFLLEIYPMVTFIKWRMTNKHSLSSQDYNKIKAFSLISKIEIALTIFIVFVASFMSRGILFPI